jgi:hypothetical protein
LVAPDHGHRGQLETKFSDVMAGDLLSRSSTGGALRDMFYLIHHGLFVDVMIFTVGYFYWVHPWMGHVYVAGIAAWCLINYTSTASARSARPARGRTG